MASCPCVEGGEAGEEVSDLIVHHTTPWAVDTENFASLFSITSRQTNLVSNLSL